MSKELERRDGAPQEEKIDNCEWTVRGEAGMGVSNRGDKE